MSGEVCFNPGSLSVKNPGPEGIKESVLITHQGCMDGSGCAILFLAAGGRRENIRYVAAGMVERFIKDEQALFDSDKFVIFADVGVSNPDYADRLEKRGNVHLLDHHKTSAFLKGRPWCHIDCENGGTACGTELLRRYLGLERTSDKRLAAVIDDHDRWKLKIPESTDLATFSVFVGQEEFIDRFAGRDVSNGLLTVTEKELLKILVKRRDESIKSAIRKAIVKDVAYVAGAQIRTVKVGYILSSEPNVSLLLDQLLEQRNEIDVACQIHLGKESVSLRSKRYDVSEMAKYFGGGGHAGAAGHRLPPNFVKDLVDEVHSW